MDGDVAAHCILLRYAGHRILWTLEAEMKLILGAFLGFFLASSSSARAPQRNPTSDSTKQNTASVSGMVVKLAGTVPLKSATVRLQGAEDRSRTFSGVTDAGGRFEIKGIDPGRYRLRVVRNGFVTQEYGQKTPSDPGIIVSLGAKQDLKDLLFRMIPSAIVAGRIQNEDGDPLPWVRVSAMRETYLRGKQKLSNEVTVVTNDLGEYRLFGLRPGRYFVSAIYRPGQRLGDGDEGESGGEDSGKLGYVQTYYPSSVDPAKAAVIAVKAGEEIPSIDMLLEPATVYSVRGRVNNFVSRYSGAGAIVVLESKPTGVAWSIPNQQVHLEKPDGSFEIRDVLPGSYTLIANWFDSGRRFQARQPIEVANADVEGVQLTIAPGINITGNVSWDGKQSLEKDSLTLTLNGADSSFVFGGQTKVAQNGSFSIPNISEGLYRLSAFGQSQDCYLKSIRFAGIESSDDEFNVMRGAQATLVVTISSRGAHVQGTVTDADHLPAAGVWVVLVPDEPHRNEFRLFRKRTTDQNGRFDIRGIAPGSYKLFSWEQVEENAWEDPEFLRPLEGKSERVSVDDGDGKTVDLEAIRSASHEQEKP